MSSQEENEYFSDGITEEIINALSKIGNLKVTSRTSSFFFKGKNLPISTIGEKLNVSTILEGSVRLAGNALRITAQLIQVEEDFHFWSETWDRKLENIFEIQDEISLLIADKLREHFGHLQIEDHLVNKQTDNTKAYEACLKAKFHENKWNPEDVNLALKHYNTALKIDPSYAQAYLGLANCYSFLGTTAFIPFEEAWEKTIRFTEHAKKLDANLSGVHYQLSNIAFFIKCDYNTSLLEMKRAVEINPNNAEARQFLSFLYIVAGQAKEANQHLNIALALNPLSEETHFFRAYFYYMIENFNKALEMLNACLVENDKNIPAHYVKTLCLLKLNRYQEVIDYFDIIRQEVVIEGERLGSLALAYIFLKDKENSTHFLNQLKEKAKQKDGYTADSYLFFSYCALENFDKAFAWVESSIESKSSLLLLRYTDPIVSNLKSDQRYLKYKTEIYKVSQNAKERISKTNKIEPSLVSEYSEKLYSHISENMPFLNSDLSLRELAKQIQLHPNQLSWLLNNSIGKNFNEFINHYRTEHFKTLAPKNKHLTIEGLAYECGFTSKTVFNTYFKKETGLTPRQFLNQ